MIVGLLTKYNHMVALCGNPPYTELSCYITVQPEPKEIKGEKNDK